VLGRVSGTLSIGNDIDRMIYWLDKKTAKGVAVGSREGARGDQRVQGCQMQQ